MNWVLGYPVTSAIPGPLQMQFGGHSGIPAVIVDSGLFES